jgi:hypothetical protein
MKYTLSKAKGQIGSYALYADGALVATWIDRMGVSYQYVISQANSKVGPKDTLVEVEGEFPFPEKLSTPRKPKASMSKVAKEVL